MTETFLETAVFAALSAGQIISDNLGRLTKDDVGLKQVSDFVTRVDKESEACIIRIIRERYPDHHILAEETVKQTVREGYRWIIDPLDGTTNYIHQYPVFCVSIALELHREVIAGVIFDPLRKDLFFAEKGKGAYLNEQPIIVSTIAACPDSLITTGFPFRRKEFIDQYLKLFKNVLFKVSDLRRAGSAALDLAYLAAGRCEGFFELGLSAWDIAAGSLIIEEAGGVITDFSGGDDYLSTGNIVAGNRAIQVELLKEVQAVFGGIVDK
ncbi:MAG: inositol monophosphatase family protein [Dissulfurispiraceae bacterium]